MKGDWCARQEGGGYVFFVNNSSTYWLKKGRQAGEGKVNQLVSELSVYLARVSG